MNNVQPPDSGGPTPGSAGDPGNPIYPLLVDFPLIERIFNDMEVCEDGFGQGKKREIASIYERLKASYFANSPSVSSQREIQASVDWRQFSPEELVAYSQAVFEDVFEFVTSVMAHYESLKACRPLTEQEKENGRLLPKLLMSLQDLMPASPEGEACRT